MRNPERLKHIVSRAVFDMPLKRMTTLRVGGPALAYVEVETHEQMSDLYRYLSDEQLPWMVLGLGSNLLVSPKGYPGVVVKLKGEFDQFRFEGERVYAGSGVGLMRLAREAQRRGLAGLEFASGIPGTVGGALVMNAGAHGEDISGICEEIEALNPEGRPENYSAKGVKWGYRSGFIDSRCIFTTIFKLTPSKVDIIKKKMDNYLTVRIHSQPKGFSAGSIFRNPEGYKAWQLIDDAGFRGFRLGGAVVSDKHSNFILNRNNATASDIHDLIVTVRKGVYEKFGIVLHPEIRMIGEFENDELTFGNAESGYPNVNEDKNLERGNS